MNSKETFFNLEIYTVFIYLVIFYKYSLFVQILIHAIMFKHVCLLQKLLVALSNKDDTLFQQSSKRI